MPRSARQLREDAHKIWWAGVQAVQPERLIPEFVNVIDRLLFIGEEQFDLNQIENITVVGAGKAGASMAVALEDTLGKEILKKYHVKGWINVPEDCIRPTQCIHLHAARPAGVNEPTEAGVIGTQEILKIVDSLGPNDLCLCLISGGGSALLPAPIPGLSLETKIQLIRDISAAGGTIHQLNAVRREISEVKGGGLSKACRAGHLVSLILSDVLGDELETIASGPTVHRSPTPKKALGVLQELNLQDTPEGKEVCRLLQSNDFSPAKCSTETCNIIIGNNATAVDAAGIMAEKLGYSHAMISATKPEATAEEVAEHLVKMAVAMRSQEGPDCLISGGEPTVELAPESKRGKGGRNQQLVLAAVNRLSDWQGLAMLSGGTDGEDGPTDAAGAFVNEEVTKLARAKDLDEYTFLRRNDAYHYFEPLGALVKTGPTHTNVCDLRVITVEK